LRFLFTCGGTAGHINPALGVAGRIRQLMPDAEFLFVGAKGNMETELVPREGYELKTVRIEGFQRSFRPKMILKNFCTAFLLVSSVAEAKVILREFQPDVAVGTGGYVCYPVLTAASAMHIPTAVHESNAVPGLTTRKLEGHVDRVMVGFESSREYYRHADKVTVTGTPVRVDFGRENRETARSKLGVGPDEPMVLAMFGSLGAGYMDDIMTALIGKMGKNPPFRLVWATGKQYYPKVRAAMNAMGVNSDRIDVREYIYDMPRQMTAADVIICRSGASTISELTYLGKPAIIVPSPNVVNHHQEKNADVLARAGAAKVLLEGHFGVDEMYAGIRGLLADPTVRENMALASCRLGVADATDRITSLIMGLAENSKMG